MSENIELQHLEDLHRKAKKHFGKPEAKPYRRHDELVRRAKLYPPKRPLATVTSFADWIFELCNNYGDEESREIGKIGEQDALDFWKREERKRLWARRTAKTKVDMASSANLNFGQDEWALEYDGTTQSDPYYLSEGVVFERETESTAEALEITALTLDGEPFTAKPDLVFRHCKTRDVLILELETWRRHQGRLPPFGWSNLKVQLWCYGMIDQWKAVPNLLLQGRVWRWSDGYDGSDSGLIFPPIDLLPWFSNDPRIHRESVELFEAFGGNYVGP